MYPSLAIETATGQRHAHDLSKPIWRPLGAGDARLWFDPPGGAARGSRCLRAGARDRLRIGLLILNRGRVGGRQIVPARWIDRMVAPSAINPNFGRTLWRGSPQLPQCDLPTSLKGTA